MKNNRNFNLGLLFGAAAGAATGWLIYSQRGKEIRKAASEKMTKTGHDIKERVSSELDHLSVKAHQFFADGKEHVEEELAKAKKKAKDMAEASAN